MGINYWVEARLDLLRQYVFQVSIQETFMVSGGHPVRGRNAAIILRGAGFESAGESNGDCREAIAPGGNS
jgi:hypothetical protein